MGKQRRGGATLGNTSASASASANAPANPNATANATANANTGRAGGQPHPAPRISPGLHRRLDAIRRRSPPRTPKDVLSELARHQNEASSLGFFGLARYLKELHNSIACGDPDELRQTYSGIFGGRDGGRQNPSTQDVVRAYGMTCHATAMSLNAVVDAEHAETLVDDDFRVETLITSLAPKVAFDIGLSAFAVQSVALTAMTGKGEADWSNNDAIREFEPRALDELRAKEKPFRAPPQPDDADPFDVEQEAGKAAWSAGRKWAAEAAWSRALAIRDDPKVRTNRAHVRTLLGRRARSLGEGYRRPGCDLVELAVEDASKAATLDPSWERAAERGAEALLALGDARGAEAEALLMASPKSARPPALLARAREAAARWRDAGSPAVSDTETALRKLLLELKRAIVRTLFGRADDVSEDYDVGEAVAARVAALLFMMREVYLNPARRVGSSTWTDIQQELRLAARAIPLWAVVASPSLRELAYMDGPRWCLHGQDRLDRIGRVFLPLGAADPVIKEKDEQERKENEHFKEYMARQTGDSSLNMSSLENVFNMFQDKGPNSERRDNSPHHICAFSMTLLTRLALYADSAVGRDAGARIIELAKDQTAIWAGGEFLGLAISAAAGLSKFGIGESPGRMQRFLRLRGSALTLAVEAVQSGDNHGMFQRALATITDAGWARRAEDGHENTQVLRQYVLSVNDGKHLSMSCPEGSRLSPKQGKDSATLLAPECGRVMGGILGSAPDVIAIMLAGVAMAADPWKELLGAHIRKLLAREDIDADETPTTQGMMMMAAMKSSGFGCFVLSRFAEVKQKLEEKMRAAGHKEVCESLIRSWHKLPFEKRSGYRWEATPSGMRAELSSEMAPVVEHKRSESEEDDEDGSDEKTKTKTKEAFEVPRCEGCGGKQGERGIVHRMRHTTCPKCLRVLRFCSDECHKVGWNSHKAACVSVQTCAMCGAQEEGDVKLRKCAKCEKVKYCSRECQVAAWKTHKAECGREHEKQRS
ncbi:hypothetical protein RI054_19g85190 [Pseudoscourfieldia marina]